MKLGLGITTDIDFSKVQEMESIIELKNAIYMLLQKSKLIVILLFLGTLNLLSCGKLDNSSKSKLSHDIPSDNSTWLWLNKKGSELLTYECYQQGTNKEIHKITTFKKAENDIIFMKVEEYLKANDRMENSVIKSYKIPPKSILINSEKFNEYKFFCGNEYDITMIGNYWVSIEKDAPFHEVTGGEMVAIGLWCDTKENGIRVVNALYHLARLHGADSLEYNENTF